MAETQKTALNKDQEKKMLTGWLQIKQSEQNTVYILSYARQQIYI